MKKLLIILLIPYPTILRVEYLLYNLLVIAPNYLRYWLRLFYSSPGRDSTSTLGEIISLLEFTSILYKHEARRTFIFIAKIYNIMMFTSFNYLVILLIDVSQKKIWGTLHQYTYINDLYKNAHNIRMSYILSQLGSKYKAFFSIILAIISKHLLQS